MTILICDRCGKPTDGNTGSIDVDLTAKKAKGKATLMVYDQTEEFGAGPTQTKRKADICVVCAIDILAELLGRPKNVSEPLKKDHA